VIIRVERGFLLVWQARRAFPPAYNTWDLCTTKNN
jgi:hypothetical protein